MIWTRILTILVLAFLLPIKLWAGCLSTTTIPSMTDNDYLAQADESFRKRLDVEQAQLSLDGYIRVLEELPQLDDVYCKVSRVAWWLGEISTDRQIKLGYFKQGIEHGKKGLEVNPYSPGLHFWLGANYGSFGEARGIISSLFLLFPLRNHVKKSIEIDPLWGDGSSHFLLGVVDYKVPILFGGNDKRALERLLTGRRIDPGNPVGLYFLAEYHYEKKKIDKAIEYLNMLDGTSVAEAYNAELWNMQRKGKSLRETIKKKYD